MDKDGGMDEFQEYIMGLLHQLGGLWDVEKYIEEKQFVAFKHPAEDGHEVLVYVEPERVCCCVRKDLGDIPVPFSDIGKQHSALATVARKPNEHTAKIREYLTPFIAVVYRREDGEPIINSIRKVLQMQLDYGDRACAALREVVGKVKGT